MALRKAEVGMMRVRPRRKEEAEEEHTGGGGGGGGGDCSCCRRRLRRLGGGEDVPPPALPAVPFPAVQDVDIEDGGSERLFETICADWGRKGRRDRPSLNFGIPNAKMSAGPHSSTSLSWDIYRG